MVYSSALVQISGTDICNLRMEVLVIIKHKICENESGGIRSGLIFFRNVLNNI